jgi:hypothetical protein
MTALAPSRSRGVVLTGWLGFMLLANAWTVYRYVTIIQDYLDHSDPRFTGNLQWGLYALLALAAINILCVIGLFFWKKLGLYGFAATSVVALVINVIVGVPLTTSLVGLVGIGILWALVQSKWDYFE